ncbi:hypothetical protein [Chryseobacterium lathyri]|jgi:hypothetical protein|uniref:Uncharacterized protein n=1 Tax=Chryseobacterium lathyri TaxID=395933 RepID=A0A511YG30_9FLAO|nr:hypothetical protein [Chryseobacterium lathyri]GEN74155.1 hypothetical protein CLA01_42270 [Chryseobacterium lathyri]
MKAEELEKYSKLIDELIDGEKTEENTNAFIDSSFNLWGEIIKESGIKDEFEFSYFPYLAIQTSARSNKFNSSFNLSLNRLYWEITFDSYINNWENVKNLNDSFMADFFTICNKYDIKFIAGYSPDYNKEITPEFNAKFKSNIFNLMHSYISLMNLDSYSREHQSLGRFSITWKLPEGFDLQKIIEELKIAFKWMYKFNYNLWKVEDIRRQNRENRQRK